MTVDDARGLWLSGEQAHRLRGALHVLLGYTELIALDADDAPHAAQGISSAVAEITSLLEAAQSASSREGLRT